MMDQPARQAVIDALNGDNDLVDKAVRRSLFALATRSDQMLDHIDERFDDHEAKVDSYQRQTWAQIKELRDELKWMRNLLVTTTITLLLGIIAAVVGVVVT